MHCVLICFVYLICFLFIVDTDSVKLLDKVSRLRSIYIWDLELTLINPNILGRKLGRELL